MNHLAEAKNVISEIAQYAVQCWINSWFSQNSAKQGCRRSTSEASHRRSVAFSNLWRKCASNEKSEKPL